MTDQRELFIELMGRHFEEEGGARIAGRLMGALLLNPAPASLDDLVEQLQVSKASISSNARLLEVWGIAEKVTVAGDRRDFYQIAADVEERVVLRMIERHRLMGERLAVGRAAVAGDSPVLESRFESMIGMVDDALSRLQERLDEARRVAR